MKTWLIIALLLTGCMKDADNRHIGGLETGPAVIRYPNNTDPVSAQPYVYPAKWLLGDLKRQMQLSYIKWGQADIVNQDGVKIHAQSNQYGLADLDEVWIDMTAMANLTTSNQTGVDTCLGYIIQGFATQNAQTDPSTPIYLHGSEANWVTFVLRTKKDFDAAIDTLNSTYFNSWLTNSYAVYNPGITAWNPYSDPNDTFASFTDNNAKYVPLYTTSGTSIYPRSSWSGVGNMQSVYAAQVDWSNPVTQYLNPSYNLPSHTFTYSLQIIRNSNGKGFASNAGLQTNTKSYELTDINATNGSGFLFMLPSDKTQQFRFVSGVVSYNMAMLAEPSSETGIVNIAFPGNFGIPVSVESGLHRVKTAAWQNNSSTISAKVHLLMSNSGQVTVNVAADKLSLADGYGGYNYQEIQVDVRSLASGEIPSGLVSVVAPSF